MSLAFLLPLGFAAFAAWALPLLIHLSRRADRRETPFAALRWIRGPERPRRRLRLEHPWLLLARLLLLAALALLLAQPVLTGTRHDVGDRVVVAPGADIAAARRSVTTAASWHWLAPGFPAIDATGTPPPADAASSTSSLLRELDADLAPDAALTVVVPAELGALDAERIALNRRADWRIVDGASPAAAGDAATRDVVVRHAPESAVSLPYLRAAVAAWNAAGTRYRLDAQPLTAALPRDAAWIVWLGAEPTPELLARVADGAVALVDRPIDGGDAAWRHASGRVLARTRAHGNGRLIGLAQPLAPATLPAMLEPAFARELERAMLGAAEPTRAPAAAVVPVQSARETTAAAPTPQRLDDLVILAIVALLALERVLAWHASREVPAA